MRELSTIEKIVVLNAVQRAMVAAENEPDSFPYRNYPVLERLAECFTEAVEAETYPEHLRPAADPFYPRGTQW